MITRVTWGELPACLRDSVERHTGKVMHAEVISTGLNCSAAFKVTTEKNGTLFLKGVRKSDGVGLDGLRNEEAVNQVVAGIGPVVLYRFDVEDWYCLAFDFIEGSHADLSPGSGDLDSVRSALNRMRYLSGNSFWLTDSDIRIPRLSERMWEHLSADGAALLDGESLLHTDTNPHNIMVSSRDGKTYVVDWAMPARGPAWVDAAYTAVRLMECGHEPQSAVEWLAPLEHWKQANPRAVAAFVDAVCRQTSAALGERGAESSNKRFRALLGFPHQVPFPAPRHPPRRA
ncbi:phosphotransferase [Streptomyces sp. PTM05]|uniref:Phosphotransferase n=2 Tax=Streptantibioticus parmotrematis TaxID=2873249 RepID=A0ABS7QUM5_9ACTN|nr:phosphotransferase [Streptantibioticus parmotrematis]